MNVVGTLARRRQTPYLGVQMEGPVAAWYARTTRGRRDHATLAASIARQLPGGAVLEIAPGPGYLAIELARSHPGKYRITGLDISHSFVRIAAANARRAGVSIDFQHGDVSHMPFANESFDFAVCVAAFKNFPDPVAALNEMHRVLRSGGQARIIDMRKDAPPAAIEQEVREMNLAPPTAWLMRWIFRSVLLRAAYTRRRLEEVIAASRFGTAEIIEHGVSFEVRLTRAPRDHSESAS